ncbi:MAG: hypothetical protein H0T62_01295 [Parachlamydiaceae bacterium]|nr:hypothetical protein [Parachlamydiaceae bacterium]
MSASVEGVGFFSPISSPGLPHPNENKVWLGRIVEWYFDWGQQAYAIVPSFEDDQTIPIEKISSEKSSLFFQAIHIVIIGLKILSCITVILPLAMLIGKYIYREDNHFSVHERPSPEEVATFIERAQEVISEDSLLVELSKIPIEEVDGLRDLMDLTRNIENQKTEFQDILDQFSPFFNQEQLQTMCGAIPALEKQISHIEELIEKNKRVIRINIFHFHTELQQVVKNKNLEDRFTSDIEVWKELQSLEKFIDQFQIALGVIKNEEGGNWKIPELETDRESKILFKNECSVMLAKRLTPKGIINLGATCFMNASVQAIISNPVFRAKLKEEDQPIYGSIQEKLRIKLEKFGIFDNKASSIIENLFAAWKQRKVPFLINDLRKLNRKAFTNSIDEVIKEKHDNSLNQEASQVSQEKTKESRMISYIERTFKDESSMLLGLGENIDWERVKKMLIPLTMELSEYIRCKQVMIILKTFVMKYEEAEVKPAGLKALAIELRSAFHFAFPGEGSLTAQHDAAVFVEFVLQAIGCTFPFTLTREGGEFGDSHVQKTTDPISLLQVPITGSNVSLQKLMNDYMSVSIEGSKTDKWTSTDDEGTVIKSFSEWTEKKSIEGEPPKNIQIQLKRFKVGNQKIRDNIDLSNNEVDLSELFDLKSNDKAIYQIKAVVVHAGSCTGGHYYSVVELAGKRFKCNDSVVTVEKNPDLEHAKGYIYFLERKLD